MSILTNSVLISVLVMALLCILRLNVFLSIIVAAFVAGLMSNIPLDNTNIYDSFFQLLLAKTIYTSNMLIKGMAGNLEIALSYILLGAIAITISRTHLMTFLLSAIANIISNKRNLFVIGIALISCCSQNLVPIHIAFIPILIPPLLSLMNKLKIDRRAVACALTFGLQAPYVTLGIGFGLIFHTTIKDQLMANGIKVSLSDIASVMWIGGVSMLIGLFFAIFVLYRKDRIYKQSEEISMGNANMGRKEYAVLFGIIVTFIVQLFTESLPLGAFLGLMSMVILGGIKWNETDSIMEDGLKMMAFIAFVMLIAAGYGEILRQSGEVNGLVDSIKIFANNKVTGAILMLIVGLLITIGIGTSFGTIPIIAAIYVPFGLSLGFSVSAIILLVGIAGALGDAGSPASDSTLGPTSGLNMDKQHDHIRDTCIPTFLMYNIPLIIAGVIGSIIL